MILPDIGTIMKLVHIVEEGSFAWIYVYEFVCSLDEMTCRIQYRLPDPLEPTQTVNVIIKVLEMIRKILPLIALIQLPV